MMKWVPSLTLVYNGDWGLGITILNINSVQIVCPKDEKKNSSLGEMPIF